MHQNVTARSSHILNSGGSDSSKSSSNISSGYHSGIGDSTAYRQHHHLDLPAVRKAASVDCLLVKRDLFRSSRDLREFRGDSHCIFSKC